MLSKVEKRLNEKLAGLGSTVVGRWTKGRHFVQADGVQLLHVTHRSHVSGARGDTHYVEATDGTLQYAGVTDLRADCVVLSVLSIQGNINKA